MDYSKVFSIFTDGSSMKNKKSGWAVYIPKLKKLFSGNMIGTNNLAELTAMKFALWYVSRHVSDEQDIYILSDSEYTINAVTGINKVMANATIINECKKYIELISANLHFVHCDAHTGGTDFISRCNDIVDKAAKREAKK
jgi:ribonuclease HI